MSYTLHSTSSDGTIREIELTPEQALDVGAGLPIAHTSRNERISVDEDGRIIRREPAIAQQLDEAA
ncbi:MAG TPA: hypothetical protein VNT54_03650 [Solirubrobacteraceae bacterium]|nr:hypothetical protein [Solirubrobacteraceae bacterium]